MSTATLSVPATVTAFDLGTGLAPAREPLRRSLSAMADMYADADAVAAQRAADDVLIYEFYDMGVPATSGDVGTSVLQPGKIGDEDLMTKATSTPCWTPPRSTSACPGGATC
jgi:glucose-6-phosphate isomerase, archaeal